MVNGSPTKTEILDEQKGRTQLANLTMSAVVLVVVMFATGLLTNMPKAVLAAIVFLIGLGLVDFAGLTRIRSRRFSEFVIAGVTGFVVFAVGVEQGIILAVVLSILEIIRRAYGPADFVVGVDERGERTFRAATPGTQSAPGLVVFRYDAELFYANASRFTDDVQAIIEGAPDKVRWLVLDCSSITDVDYSAGIALARAHPLRPGPGLPLRHRPRRHPPAHHPHHLRRPGPGQVRTRVRHAGGGIRRVPGRLSRPDAVTAAGSRTGEPADPSRLGRVVGPERALVLGPMVASEIVPLRPPGRSDRTTERVLVPGPGGWPGTSGLPRQTNAPQ